MTEQTNLGLIFARISTHTLTWSVTVGDVSELAESINFNSHAHVERDENGHLDLMRLTISTHTLTWSVTLTCDSWVNYEDISTHTLTWSVTVFKCNDKDILPDFNSHAHVERDEAV